MTITAGIDLGSRAVKAVLYDAGRRVVVAARVADATGDHRSDADLILSALLRAARLKPSRLAAVILTGYGRHTADLDGDVVTEIACHAAGARALFARARTVIDIGGQDSKAVYLGADGKVGDFAMNDRCAAGTGRFLETMALALGLSVEQLGQHALDAQGTAVRLSSVCTVFAESEVVALIARGESSQRVALGIHEAIVRRVGSMLRRLGVSERMVFAGGVARNACMCQLLAQEMALPLAVPDNPQTVGALGAALYAARQVT